MYVIFTDQLSRLHMILKPFMLRRVKKDVENELSDKVCSAIFLYFLCYYKLCSTFFIRVSQRKNMPELHCIVRQSVNNYVQ